MENVYLEIIKLLSEGSIFRILLILFSFFSFLLCAGVGFLWFKNPELFKEILRTHFQTPETIEAESKITPLQPVSALNLIRGLFSVSIDFHFTEKGAVLFFPPYMRTRLEDELKEILQNIISSIREISAENRSIEFDFSNTVVLNKYSENCIFDIIKEVILNNGVYLVIVFQGKHLRDFETDVRKFLSESNSKSVKVKRKK
ncbi:hypothetical protein MKU65_09400 [Leptospira interrogans]|uniref:Uncharacterized protein n=1 Tax=Leptospira interrogans serovar Hardjo str. Norma TaxID=1279460 RepID=A0A0M5L942_LEPIR|nr:hypothetical protein [Leptospira interrogans]ALE39536.1 hypothetical protein G436_2360 [Leptospira interrogans serovar Hardjo str. Norma]ALO00646.1 hypothetical protein LIH_09790 [Leptospira interrogans serovar Hardjo-prajitno]EKO96161.1 hypothetical protein LEP1GSC057_1809 [Leptospira interrogans str. Brem 329]EMN82873.1 hypothetical protein LEP1GSC106_1318 [Leptospira interrogans serovar Grippotyphosa str. UI 12764]MCH1886479.1 hypothetical protein [Leptospira interrogans]